MGSFASTSSPPAKGAAFGKGHREPLSEHFHSIQLVEVGAVHSVTPTLHMFSLHLSKFKYCA